MWLCELRLNLYWQKLTIKESDVLSTSWHHCQGKLSEICNLKSNLESRVINLHNLDKDLSALETDCTLLYHTQFMLRSLSNLCKLRRIPFKVRAILAKIIY